MGEAFNIEAMAPTFTGSCAFGGLIATGSLENVAARKCGRFVVGLYLVKVE